MSGPHEVVDLAALRRFQHYRELGVKRIAPWSHLTDAQKLPWLIRANDEVGAR